MICNEQGSVRWPLWTLVVILLVAAGCSSGTIEVDGGQGDGGDGCQGEGKIELSVLGSPLRTVQAGREELLGVVVEARCQGPVAGESIAFEIVGAETDSRLSSDEALTSSEGVAAVTLRAGQQAGEFRVWAHHRQNAEGVYFTILVVGEGVQLVPAGPTEIEMYTGESRYLRVRLVEVGSYDPVSGEQVGFEMLPSSGDAQIEGSPATTDGEGLAGVLFVAGTAGTSYLVEAQALRLEAGKVTFRVQVTVSPECHVDGDCPGGHCQDGKCVSDPCEPESCASLGKECGRWEDGCGGTLSCGDCPSGEQCDGQGQCVAVCVPETCASLGKECGSWPDGCGGTLSCGDCPSGEQCDGQGQCVAVCVPETCASLGKECGSWPDGCGGTLSCGGCPSGQQCDAQGNCVPSCDGHCNNGIQDCGETGIDCGGECVDCIRLSVDPARPHVILAGAKPIFLAGYYEAPDDPDCKWPSYNWYLDRVAGGGCNVVRLPFASLDNPYNAYEPWHRTGGSLDCSLPNEDFYTNWLRPVCQYARDLGIYVVLTLYSAENDWDCVNKNQSTRNLAYDKILEYTYDLKNVIIEVNWEMEIISDSFMHQQADYFQTHPGYPGVITIVTDWHHGDGADAGPNKINGRHRDWDRTTSLWYWERNRPSLWTERWFRYPGIGGQDPMTAEEARVHLYRDALLAGTGIMFYYTRWNSSAEPDLPQGFLDQCGYAVSLSESLPLASMTPEEELGRSFTDRGFWSIDPGVCYAGYLENGGNVTVDLSDVSGTIGYEWYNPRTGAVQGQGTVNGGGSHIFGAPDTNDWVLVIMN